LLFAFHSIYFRSGRIRYFDDEMTHLYLAALRWAVRLFHRRVRSVGDDPFASWRWSIRFLRGPCHVTLTQSPNC